MRIATSPPPAETTQALAGTSAPGRPVVVDLTAPSALRGVVPAVAARTELAGAEPAPLPLGRLAGLAGSGAFAVWTSLTCFVC